MKPVLFYVYLSFFCTLRFPLNFLVCPDQQLQCLHSHLDGGGGIVRFLLVQSGGLPLLVPDHMEHRATAHPAGSRHGKQRGGLHL